MEDSSDLHLVDHDRTMCATCRTRRGETLVCAVCQTALVPGGAVMLCYTSQETPRHRGIIHARCPFRKSYASTFWRRQRIEWGHWRIMFGDFSLILRSSTMPVPLAPPVTLGGDE